MFDEERKARADLAFRHALMVEDTEHKDLRKVRDAWLVAADAAREAYPGDCVRCNNRGYVIHNVFPSLEETTHYGPTVKCEELGLCSRNNSVEDGPACSAARDISKRLVDMLFPDEHVHACPECYEDVVCEWTCSPTDGDDDVNGPARGYTTICDRCEIRGENSLITAEKHHITNKIILVQAQRRNAALKEKR